MKVLIITVAGMSERFSRSIGSTCVKCLYNEGDFKTSLLYRLIHKYSGFDKYIIVGGFCYDELSAAVNKNFNDISDKIILVENKFFKEYGSGYSLFKGLGKAIELNSDEVVFAEGDLYVDDETFKKVCDAKNSVITVNHDPIWANKAVAFYFNKDNKLHYIYDTNHSMLQINEPFLGIFNSGQIWKFSDKDLMRKTFYELTEEEWQGTNLVYIERYFKEVENRDIITFKEWINCNTVEDFRQIGEKLI